MSTDERTYRVVVNHEAQHSIWSADQEIPAGWSAEGFTGTKTECLDHITKVWTDIRPRSLRERLAEDAAGREEVGNRA